MNERLQCAVCAHLVSNKDGLVYICEAFPKGIPEDIITGLFMHTKKHPEQKNDVVFEHENRVEICDG